MVYKKLPLKKGELFYHTKVAQLVEHRSPKPSVGSSSLSFRAIKTQAKDEEIF